MSENVNSSSVPSYRLYYFNIRGLGESIRLVLAQIGVPFEDIRITDDQWPQYKDKMPFCQLPVLEVDGVMLTQSMTIVRFLARKYGLEADEEWERAVGDELATSWLDLFPRSASAWAEQDKAVKKQKFLQLVEEFIKPRLKITEARLLRSKSGYVAGNKVTWCDFAIYNLLVMLRDYLKVPLTSYPCLVKFVEKIDNMPRVKAWNDSHPEAQWSKVPGPMD